MFKNYVQKRLEKYVRQYFVAHPEVKLVVVTGSVGKTSTKHAIGTLLSSRYRVRMHMGNHNSDLSAPLAILGIDYPGNIRQIGAWISVFKACKQRIKQPTDVDVIVQELGTDHPGEISQFGTYLRPDIALVTAVTPEHMEYFKTIEAVAAEELAVANYSRLALINRDDIEGRFAETLTNQNIGTYGTSGAAEYRFEIQDFTVENGYVGNVIAPEFSGSLPASIKVVGEHSLRPVMGAVAVAVKLGLTPQEIASRLGDIRAVPGRMNLLRGIGGTMVIDDTYNSSPAAAEAAMQAFYSISTLAPQRIVVLGDMRELGDASPEAHARLGDMCDSSLLAWVVTVGPDSEKYLAPAARARGCQVKTFMSAMHAAEFVRSVTEEKAAILVKGSQNTIFLEEAVKVFIDMTEDAKLVRQGDDWMAIKNEFFSQFPDIDVKHKSVVPIEPEDDENSAA